MTAAEFILAAIGAFFGSYAITWGVLMAFDLWRFR